MTLHEIGLRHGTDKATHHKFCDFYEEHLPGRDFSGRLLEIGIMHGASLRTWAEYYPNAEIVGIDTFDKSYLNLPNNVSVVHGDATDHHVTAPLGTFDIIVDDGSHLTSDQQVSFLWLYYNQLADGGIYILEDLHTSLPGYPGPYVDSKVLPVEMLERQGVDFRLYRRDPDELDSMTSVIFK
ncbi:methyltransferase [Mycobacterium phage Omega]|uniref:Methyltransferase n=1 Tax=Mycobacterium phage Omega TaxID=2907835 RepID=Q854P7_BPMOM|nr:methyltransferase [Mycobacterium phage Omega]AAN12661.1 methyltransferase [Mycobacterium phage Omega]